MEGHIDMRVRRAALFATTVAPLLVASVAVARSHDATRVMSHLLRLDPLPATSDSSQRGLDGSSGSRNRLDRRVAGVADRISDALHRAGRWTIRDRTGHVHRLGA